MVDYSVLQSAFLYSLLLFSPVFIACMVGGLVAAVLQSWLRIDDIVFPQLVRLLAAVAVAYLGFEHVVQELAEFSNGYWSNYELYF